MLGLNVEKMWALAQQAKIQRKIDALPPAAIGVPIELAEYWTKLTADQKARILKLVEAGRQRTKYFWIARRPI